LVALCNALSSAQLAASHPVSGGTYEYGYAYLRPEFGFTAGWMFLCAKCASAGTAALGFAGYLLDALGAPADLLAPVSAATAVVFTAVVLGGMRRSSFINVVIVTVTLVTLVTFVLGGLPSVLEHGASHFHPFFGDADSTGDAGPVQRLLHATALMFVAYTGYGRIATLGEEVREPRRTIPRAILITLVISAALYSAVGAVAVGVVGAEVLADATRGTAAPLEVVARRFELSGIHWVVSIGAMTAMLGVLLNLILGLSRVLLAMGRRGDMPAATARLNAARTTPYVAVVAIGVVVTALACTGSVKTTWSFSAFTVLLYYAITNLAALRLPAHARLYPRAFAWCGLGACLFLAFWVEWRIWAVGLGLVLLGLIWHALRRRARRAAA
jgi:APA family basic amino acid/polyamine antiporter